MTDLLKNMLNIEPIDLNGAVPFILLIGLAALILATLILRSFLRSRIAAGAVFALIIVYGSATIVGGLQALAGLAAVTLIGLSALAFALHRWPTLANLVRALTNHPEIPTSEPYLLDDSRYLQMPPRPTQARLSAPEQPLQITAPRARRSTTVKIPKGMGFDE